MIQKQVELIWKVTDNWKHPVSTSYDSLKKSYTSEQFDPSTRFYAMDGGNLVGYVTSSVVEDKEKGNYGSMRFPIAIHNDPEIVDALVKKVFERFSELGISRILSIAGPGFGETLKISERHGFTQLSLSFKRAKAPIEDIKVSGNHAKVVNYEEKFHDEVRDIFVSKLHKGFGDFMHDWALSNKVRKEQIAPFRTSWKLIEDEKGIAGFSYLHRSDHNPKRGDLAPMYAREDEDVNEIFDRILSAHLQELSPKGVTHLGTYLNGDLLKMEEIYNSFGFHFDPAYAVEKTLN